MGIGEGGFSVLTALHEPHEKVAPSIASHSFWPPLATSARFTAPVLVLAAPADSSTRIDAAQEASWVSLGSPVVWPQELHLCVIREITAGGFAPPSASTTHMVSLRNPCKKKQCHKYNQYCAITHYVSLRLTTDECIPESPYLANKAISRRASWRGVGSRHFVLVSYCVLVVGDSELKKQAVALWESKICCALTYLNCQLS